MGSGDGAAISFLSLAVDQRPLLYPLDRVSRGCHSAPAAAARAGTPAIWSLRLR
jgi:hypothetical protein